MLEARRQALQAALEDPVPQVRAAAATALESLAPMLRMKELVAGLDSDDRGRRVQSLFALEGVRCTEVLAALLSALRDPDPDVRAAAVQVVGSRAETKALPELVKCLRDSEASVRMYAAEALGGYRDRRLVPYLASVVHKDPDSGVVEAALRSLGRIGDADAQAPLLVALRDQRAGVRREAASALGLLEFRQDKVD